MVPKTSCSSGRKDLPAIIPVTYLVGGSDTLLYNLLSSSVPSIQPPILPGFLASKIPLYYIVEYSSVYISFYYYGYQSP